MNGSETVGRIVAEHPATATVFWRRGIDFCCHGEMSLEQARRERGLLPEEVGAELKAARARPSSGELPDDLSTPALIRRISRRHHTYLRRALPAIGPLLAKVTAVHGDDNPKLAGLRSTFEKLASSLEPHLTEEETGLFPLLLGPSAAQATSGLDRMAKEHQAVGAILGELRELSDGYSTPGWGCASYQLLMSELAELEADLLEHIHLENHVLMPRFVKPSA